MALAYSEIDVCNLALDRLGQPPIVSLDDSGKAPTLCKRMYPLARDEMLRRVPWRRLKKRAVIAAVGVPPVWGDGLLYELPGDLLKLLDVYSNSNYVQNVGWELEGNQILTQADGPLHIRYIVKSNDPSSWDSLMISTVAAYMAKDMAETLTQDATKKQYAYQDFMAIMDEAKHANSQEGVYVNIDDADTWVTDRYGGSSNVTARGISEPT